MIFETKMNTETFLGYILTYNINILLFWSVTPCSVVLKLKTSDGTARSESTHKTTRCRNLEDHILINQRRVTLTKDFTPKTLNSPMDVVGFLQYGAQMLHCVSCLMGFKNSAHTKSHCRELQLQPFPRTNITLISR
jgi:hypothetical protein